MHPALAAECDTARMVLALRRFCQVPNKELSGRMQMFTPGSKLLNSTPPQTNAPVKSIYQV